MKCSIDLLGKMSEKAERDVILQCKPELCEGERAGVTKPSDACKEPSLRRRGHNECSFDIHYVTLN